MLTGELSNSTELTPIQLCMTTCLNITVRCVGMDLINDIVRNKKQLLRMRHFEYYLIQIRKTLSLLK